MITVYTNPSVPKQDLVVKGTLAKVMKLTVCIITNGPVCACVRASY